MMFSAQTYQSRRYKLFESLKEGLILFPANGYASRNYVDNSYPFRQDSTFLYYCGINIPELVLIINIDKGKSILFADELTQSDIIWTGAREKIIDISEKAGIDEVLPYSELASYIGTHLSLHTNVHYLPPYRSEHILKLSHWLNLPTAKISQNFSLPLIKAVVKERETKSQEEIQQIQQALEISQKIHSVVLSLARSGFKESFILGEVMKQVAISETEFAYPPILSINGQILHNHHYDNTLFPNQLLLADIGAESPMGYASDITRTFPVDGLFSERQKDIYTIVLDAQEAAIRALFPNKPFVDIHLIAAETLTKGLIELGLMKGDPQEAVKEGAHALFFPHGLGHMMGLDVHDMEHLGENFVGYGEDFKRSKQFGLSSLRLAKRLKEDFVVTIEPGLYFIPDLIDAWKTEKKWHSFIQFDKLESYKDFGGIRIEDDLLITKEGAKLLGNYIDKHIADIENKSSLPTS